MHFLMISYPAFVRFEQMTTPAVDAGRMLHLRVMSPSTCTINMNSN